MSGTDPTTETTQGTTPAVGNATPDVTLESTVSAQQAVQQAVQGGAMLSQGKWAGAVALIAMVTVSLCVLAAVGVMAYRVAVDGNSPLTADISGKLTMIGLGGIGSLVLALFGSNSLIAKLMEKLL